jgi:guanylate kinase
MMEMNEFDSEGKINYNQNLFPEEPSFETVYASSLFFTKKIKRLILCGKGGSGKDHLRQILEQKGFKYCVSHTTRPIREGEENGKDYWFIESSRLVSMADSFYEAVFFNDWFYGTSLEEFYSSNLFIMTPKGVEKLKPEDRKESTILYLNIDEEARRSRLESRRDADDVKRRLEADFVDFKDFTDFDFEIKDSNFTDVGDIGNVYYYTKEI